MQFYQIQLQAGQAYTHSAAGRIFLIDYITGAASVDVTLLDMSGSPKQIMPGRKVLFKCITEYSGVILQAATDCTVGFFVSFDDVQNGYADGGNVSVPGGVQIVNTAESRVPVDVGGATINVTATNVEISNTDANPVPVVQAAGASFDVAQKAGTSFDVEQKAGTSFDTKAYLAATVTNTAPAAIGAAASAIVAASAARRGLRLRNAGGSPVAIGGAGITYANAAVILQPGETWNENEAPGAAWYGICDTGLASTLNIQEIA